MSNTATARILFSATFPQTSNSAPPGWIRMLADRHTGQIGIIPGTSGNAEWIRLLDEKQTAGRYASFFEDDTSVENGWKSLQRFWLQSARRIHGWKLAASLETHQRTWQGWEMGKPMPYHKAARLAGMLIKPGR